MNFDGTDVTGVSIVFKYSNGKEFSGPVKDGSFTLGGVEPGSAKVFFIVPQKLKAPPGKNQPPAGMNEEQKKQWEEKYKHGESGPSDGPVTKDIPPSYLKADTTKLSVTVEPKGRTDLGTIKLEK